jgi:hypothetical protein
MQDLNFLNNNKLYTFTKEPPTFYTQSSQIDFNLIAQGLERSRMLTNKLKLLKPNKCQCSNNAVFCDCDETFITNDLKEAAPLILPYIKPIKQFNITPCPIRNKCDCLPNCNCTCPCPCVNYTNIGIYENKFLSNKNDEDLYMSMLILILFKNLT